MANTHPATRTRIREETPTDTHGSRTLTVHETQEQSEDEEDVSSDEIGVLRLRGDMNSRNPRAIRWANDVIDNEHMNKKKSKICCIYHRPRAVGESSSESSSSDDSDSSSDSEHERCSNHDHKHKPKKKRNPRDVSPNAYERQPVYKDRPQPPPYANNPA
ncbi:hypothetical protein K501DRAFT_320396 [Backusella circina FSU 941]|nr:hypothetical protein K501DRAFT_320396 [Backusella circina FSU 941]